MIRAPRVNQIRFLSSVALEKAPKLMLAASCSAADAMGISSWTYCPELLLLSCLGRLRGLRRNHLDAAAGLLDRGNGGLGGAGDLDRQLGLDLALGQQADAVALAPDHAGTHQGGAIHRGARRELARVD